VLVDFLEYLGERFELEISGGIFDDFHVSEPADDSLEAAFTALHLLPTAPLEVAKAAHKALALIHHPDRAGGDVQRMQRINAAFDLIMESLQEAVAA
jgi:DnaJ-domain-containing protein 1